MKVERYIYEVKKPFYIYNKKYYTKRPKTELESHVKAFRIKKSKPTYYYDYIVYDKETMDIETVTIELVNHGFIKPIDNYICNNYLGVEQNENN